MGKPPTFLVEWDDGERLRRAYVPSEEVEDGRVSAEVLAACVEVGVNWAEHIIMPTALEFERQLKRSGIWTVEELGDNYLLAQKAFLRAAGLAVTPLIQAVSKLEG